MTDVRNWIEPLRESGMPRLAAALEEQCDLVDRLQEAIVEQLRGSTCFAAMDNEICACCGERLLQVDRLRNELCELIELGEVVKDG